MQSLFNRWVPRLVIGLAIAMSAGASAFAQNVPEPVTMHGVTYVTGGIGEDEVQAFRAVAHQYNVRMTFASKTGHYLSDVDVAIVSAGKRVLSVRTNGPFLFVRLPPSFYEVKARHEQKVETQRVLVPTKGDVEVRFYW